MSVAPLSRITIRLHWLIAIAVVCLFAAGKIMSVNEIWFMYPIHKSLGVLVLLLVVPRLVVRLKEGWPKPVAPAPKAQEIVANLVHWALILATIALPVSGMLMSIGGGHGLAIFGLELVAMNPDPANPMEVLPTNENMAAIGHFGHGLWAKVLLVSFILHVAGAIKHHHRDKDATLTRMLGRDK